MDVQKYNFSFPPKHWAGSSSGSPCPQWPPRSCPGGSQWARQTLPCAPAACWSVPTWLCCWEFKLKKSFSALPVPALGSGTADSRVRLGHRLQHGAVSASCRLWHSAGIAGHRNLGQGTRLCSALPRVQGICFVPGYWTYTQNLFLILQCSPYASTLWTGGRRPAHTDTDLHKIIPPLG